MPVELVLEAFESAVTMSTLGALDSSAVPEISGAHAEAVLEVEAEGAAGRNFGALYDAFLERAWDAVVAGPAHGALGPN
jgi:hypothetical protein